MLDRRTVPFPSITDDGLDEWQWPAPPFAWRHAVAAGNGTAQPCRIESRSGACVDVELVRLDPQAASLAVRFAAGASEVSLPFSMFRQLTLGTPLTPLVPQATAPIERVPAAAQERDYRVQLVGHGKPLEGRTAGHVERAEGLYLFRPSEEESSVERVFVPRSAYVKAEFGRSAEEIAADRWITSRSDLLAAIERQQRMPVMPLGQSLIDLGLLTPTQLERALSRQTTDVPLGEMLVAEGRINRADLQTALAHKMGYPLVDLARFPIDPVALRRIAPRLALWARALPLMIDNERVIVAVDKPARIARLCNVNALAEVNVVPVLASKAKIMLALGRLMQQDVWYQNVAGSQGFYSTTA